MFSRASSLAIPSRQRRSSTRSTCGSSISDVSGGRIARISSGLPRISCDACSSTTPAPRRQRSAAAAPPGCPIDEGIGSVEAVAEEILDLDAALSRLADVDPRKVRVVEMKFFAGMTNQEVACALSISDATVERDWKLARAWLINAVAGR